MRASDAVAPLLATLDDPHSYARHFAVSCLGMFEERAALLGLVKALGDPDERIRLNAVLCLHDSKDLIAARGLCDAMRHPDACVRYYAVRASARNRCPGTVAQLLVTLQDSDYMIRDWSARILGKIGDAAAVEQMVAALQCEGDDEFRRTIIWALGEITAATVTAAESAIEAAKAVLNVVPPALRKVCA